MATLFTLVACTAAPAPTPSPDDRSGASVVLCEQIGKSLYDFQHQLRTSESANAKYLMVGNPSADEAILFIIGTSGIIPDWDVHMITNAEHASARFSRDPASDVSLCRDHLLVFMDYPGVGTGLEPVDSYSFDGLSSAVDSIWSAVESDLDKTFAKRHIVSWSLGTLVTLRYLGDPSRTHDISSVFLFGTKPGGGATGDQAGCVTQALGHLATGDFRCLGRTVSESTQRLQKFGFLALFPLENQTGIGQDPTSCTDFSSVLCTGTHPEDGKDVPVRTQPCGGSCATTPCPVEAMCGRAFDRFAEARVLPGSNWYGQLEANLYAAERALIPSYNCCSVIDGETRFCPDDATTCAAGNPSTADDGGVCYCDETLARSDPTIACSTGSGASGSYRCSSDDAQLENLVVFSGDRDLYIDSRFGKAVADQFGAPNGRRCFFEVENAGHGALLQTPAVFQEVIHDILTNGTGRYAGVCR
jgi:hypothetical protein